MVRINSPAYPRITRLITMCMQPKELAAAASSSWKCFASNDPNFPLQSSPSAVEIKFAGTHAATLRRSIAAAINELSAERRRPTLTQNQVRAMIGGGAKNPVERASVGDSRRSRRAVSQRWT